MLNPTARAHVDFETRSACDLKKAGLHRYSQDPTTWPWGFSWWLGDNAQLMIDDAVMRSIGLRVMNQWHPGDPDPAELLEHIANGGTFVAHNAAFERHMWNVVVRGRIAPHWPELHLEQQDCTMARAAAIAHPQQLDKLGPVLGLDHVKDREGSALMMQMAKPRRFNEDGTITWWDDEPRIARLFDYCDDDVYTETDADEALPPLTAQQHEMWLLDQRINDRGVHVDLVAVNKLSLVADIAKKQADRNMRRLTGGAVPRCTNVGKLIEWLNGRGIEITSLKKNEQDDVIYIADLRDDADARAAIELRRSSSKTSVAKYAAMDKCVSNDGTIKGLLQWHGAATGRRAGRLVQPQNFPRVDMDKDGNKIEWLHDMLADPSWSPKDIYDAIEFVYGVHEPLALLSKALRSCFIAAPGNLLIGGDFSNVEGRINAWLAGETWKLEAFTAYDEGRGPDLYIKAAAGILGKDVTAVTKFERQSMGKVSELALGFQGSIGAFITMGETYGVNPYDLSAPVQNAANPAQWEATKEKYHAKGTNKYGLFEREWVAIKIIVDNWRATHPNVVASWWAYQDAAIQAVAEEGTVVYCAAGRLAYYYDGRCLWGVLPSGRMLCYSSPWIVEEVVERTRRDGTIYNDVKRTVHFMGIHPKTKQWGQRSLYGGLQCENFVQATAVDLLDGAMLRVERAGYPVVLTVHDEILTEVSTVEMSRRGLSVDTFKNLMAQGEQWSVGLPTAVAAWDATRYVK